MSKKLHVHVSPLTNTIFCGHVSKDGTCWLNNKEDVTLECLFAVYHHIKNFGNDMELTDSNGKKIILSIKEL